MAIPGQFAKLTVHQSVFVAKLQNLMSAKCTTPTLYCRVVYIKITVLNGNDTTT